MPPTQRQRAMLEQMLENQQSGLDPAARNAQYDQWAAGVSHPPSGAPQGDQYASTGERIPLYPASGPPQGEQYASTGETLPLYPSSGKPAANRYASSGEPIPLYASSGMPTDPPPM